MKELLRHNPYQEPRGEDQVFDTTGWLLGSPERNVLWCTMHNQAVTFMSKLGLDRKTIWNREAYQRLRQLIRRDRPDITHCTNILPLISPAVYSAARDDVPMVQALHNYRVIWPQAR